MGVLASSGRQQAGCPKVREKKPDDGVDTPLEEPRGLVSDIQRFSIYDGRGIRTLVFMKGCPLRCLWCCNPESQIGQRELMLFPTRCIGCGRCLEACIYRAVARGEAGALMTNRSICQTCGRCVEACAANARTLIGNTVSVDEVLREVNKDQVFYRTSGGGVTISGGEPLAQAAFVRELLQACRRYGINTAIETCGHAPWEDFASVLAHTDNILFDIKHLDANVHSRLTGVSNKLILENLRRAVASGMSVILRMPLVKGCTADAETVRGVAALAVELGIAELHLLPYHRLGESKYRALRREYPLQGVEPLADEEIKHLQEIAEDGTGLLISVGG